MKQPKKIKRQMINSINYSIYSNRINKHKGHKQANNNKLKGKHPNREMAKGLKETF